MKIESSCKRIIRQLLSICARAVMTRILRLRKWAKTFSKYEAKIFTNITWINCSSVVFALCSLFWILLSGCCRSSRLLLNISTLSVIEFAKGFSLPELCIPPPGIYNESFDVTFTGMSNKVEFKFLCSERGYHDITSLHCASPTGEAQCSEVMTESVFGLSITTTLVVMDTPSPHYYLFVYFWVVTPHHAICATFLSFFWDFLGDF